MFTILAKFQFLNHDFVICKCFEFGPDKNFFFFFNWFWNNWPQLFSLISKSAIWKFLSARSNAKVMLYWQGQWSTSRPCTTFWRLISASRSNIDRTFNSKSFVLGNWIEGLIKHICCINLAGHISTNYATRMINLFISCFLVGYREISVKIFSILHWYDHWKYRFSRSCCLG